MGDKDSNIVETLKSYKKLSEDESKHDHLLKDKTVLLYTATLLDNKNLTIVKLCMEILNQFAENESNHKALLNTFGIFEALESLSIKSRENNRNVSEFATEIVNKLRQSAPPAYRTRLRVKNNNKNYRKTSYMYLLHLEDLGEENRKHFDETLIQTRGIISFVVDTPQKRCTVRIAPKMNIKTIISKIELASGIKPLIVSKNRTDNTEELYDILQDGNKTIASPEYFPEEDTPPKGKSLTRISTFTKNASGLLKSAVDTWNKSFYW